MENHIYQSVDTNFDTKWSDFFHNNQSMSEHAKLKLLQELWDTYDKDMNGVMDAEELRILCLDYIQAIPAIQALKSKYSIRVWAQSLKDLAKIISIRIFQKVDHNGDGCIDRDEFMNSFWSIIGEPIAETTSKNEMSEYPNRRTTVLLNRQLSERIQKANISEQHSTIPANTAGDVFADFANTMTQASKCMKEFVETEKKTVFELKSLLQLEPSRRSETDIKNIAETFRPILREYKLTDSAIKYICRKATVQFYQDGETVFSYGDRPSSFLIVLSGSILQYVYDINGHPQTIGTFIAGECCGETGLNEGTERQCTAVGCAQVSVVAHIPRKVYIRHMKYLYERQTKLKLKLLRRCSLLNNSKLSSVHLEALSTVATFKPLKHGEVVLQQGSRQNEFISFVASGSLVLLHELPPELGRPYVSRGNRQQLRPKTFVESDEEQFKLELAKHIPKQMSEALDVPLQFHQKLGNSVSLNSLLQPSNGFSKGAPVILQVGILGPYAVFGEESLQSIDTSVAPINQISVVAAEKSLILLVPKKEFVRKLPSEVIKELAEHCKSNPSRRELLRHLEDMERWDSYTKAVLQDLTNKPFRFRDENGNNWWRDMAVQPIWLNSRPDPDAGANHAIKSRYYRKRLQSMGIPSKMNRNVQPNLLQCEKTIDALLNRFGEISIQLLSTPRGQKSPFEGETLDQLQKRNQDFSIDGIEKLLVNNTEKLDQALALAEETTRNVPKIVHRSSDLFSKGERLIEPHTFSIESSHNRRPADNKFKRSHTEVLLPSIEEAETSRRPSQMRPRLSSKTTVRSSSRANNRCMKLKWKRTRWTQNRRSLAARKSSD